MSRVPRGVFLKAALLPLLVLVFFLFGRSLGLGTGLGELREWIAQHGVLGGAVFLGLFALVGVSALPGLPLTLAAGALFGTLQGLVLASVGTTLGAALAFLLARHLARDYLRHRLGHRRVFKVVERWTAERGALAVALTRLFPIFPYSLLNFAFGLTQVGFWTYLFWSWLTMLPGHLFYVAGSDALAQGISSGKVPWPLVLLAAAVLVFLGLLVPWARRRLREGPGGPEPDTDEEPAAR
ncbi:MAG: TVP38/TMEM64 family protein [Candidatus Krumholzibacteriia bacterium]|nr:TVP38/TMEM64 family protein [Candidatus Latescibacterota bacterium]